jgi:esterase/lipase/1-acyl-sn-glycerol-3-phosphate acyltransferase
MLKLILRISQFVIYLIKKLSGAHITSSGEAIPEAPVLFLANHFTRFETVIVPYLLFSRHQRISRSLADDTFFAGWMGEYLRLIGAVSDKNKEKDCIILDSMLSGSADWIIYPEGNMVKNKQIIFKQGEFHIHTKSYKGHVHTGAAVLALKSEIMRERIKQTHDEAAILRFCKAHRMNRSKAEEHVHLHIVPLSITYYPIRPGESRLLLFIDRWMNLRGTRFFEELEVEINLLMKANIHLHFGKPISVKSYLDAYLAEHGGSIGDDALADRLIRTQRKVLTTDIMREVYGNMQINFDHLFILSLVTMPMLKVSPDHLKKLIYKNARELRERKELNLHPELQTRLFHLILDRNYAPFLSAIKLAQAQKILYRDSDGDYLFDKSLLEKAYDFHKIRVKDTLQVILNEIRWQEKIVAEAEANAKLSEQALRVDNFEYLKAIDRDHYEKEFLAYHPVPPPPDSIGASRIFFDPKNRAGLVFSHGYLSVPAALEAMGRYLFARGINVYLPRLSGHGTDPEALKNVTAEAWESDFERAFTAMRQACDTVFIGGFSTGGLLALLHAAAYDVDGVIVVNTALKLNDLQVNYVVTTLNVFNEMIEYLHARGIKEWIENDSEVSDMNYPKHPLSSVAEVESLMNKTRKALPGVKAPLLIIQGDRDPTVNPKSADLIYHGVSTTDKELMLIPRTEHNILTGSRKKEADLFENIYDYLSRLLAKQAA